MRVPDELVRRWEGAYRRYGAADQATDSATGSAERGAAREFAVASRDVAAAWRDMERVPGLPWWVVAALVAGAQAFEVQAREWAARAEYSSPAAVSAAPARLAAHAQPSPRPRHQWRSGSGESDG